MKPGDLLEFCKYLDSDCEKPAGWADDPDTTFATVIEVYGHENGYWTCDLMWPDGTIDNIELHELEYEIANESG